MLGIAAAPVDSTRASDLAVRLLRPAAPSESAGDKVEPLGVFTPPPDAAVFTAPLPKGEVLMPHRARRSPHSAPSHLLIGYCGIMRRRPTASCHTVSSLQASSSSTSSSSIVDVLCWQWSLRLPTARSWHRHKSSACCSAARAVWGRAQSGCKHALRALHRTCQSCTSQRLQLGGRWH